METDLHKKIKDQCSIDRRGGSGHWINDWATTMWVAEAQMTTTTKRICYAAFVGPVPAAMDVRSSCGVDQCIAPDHLVLAPGRNWNSREISLPDQVAAYKDKSRKFVGKTPETVLPAGLTLKQIETVKLLSKEDNSLAHIARAAELSMDMVMKIRGGTYDDIVKRYNTARAGRKGHKDHTNADSVADLSDDTLPLPADPARLEVMANNLAVPSNDKMTEEERTWLKTMTKK